MKHIVFIICCTMYATILSAQTIPDQLPELAAWWSADSIQANNGDAIETWTTNNNEFMFVTQSDADARPTLQTNVLNGHPVLRFDGVDDYLDGGDILSIQTSGATIFTIAKSNRDNGVFIAKSIAAGEPNRYGILYNNSGKINFLYHDIDVKSIQG